MLILSLIYTAILLGICTLSQLFLKRHATAVILWTSGLSLLSPFCIFQFLILVELLSLLLFVGTCVWYLASGSVRSWFVMMATSTALSYGITGWMAWQAEREFEDLRRIYPLESMVNRAPWISPEVNDVPLSSSARQRMERLEARLQDHQHTFRKMQLQRLHEDRVRLFINSPGFGFARMMLPSRLSMIASPTTPRPQAGPRFEVMGKATWTPLKNDPESEKQFEAILDDELDAFASSQSFGWIKDREHVAGFIPHGQRWGLEHRGDWQIQHQELVSLITHDRPVVYDSKDLPRMDTVQNAPVRELDAFEESCLRTLQDGEDLAIGQVPDGLRMLGAIRSVPTCTVCHGGKPGVLLGAFSYSLVRKPMENTLRDGQNSP